jgi:RNA polymerase sigma-70 factor (ECF subfamily)
MALKLISYQTVTDEELLAPIANGNTAAFDELYKRYGQKLFAYFFRMLWKNKELAEDCTQELFFKIIKHGANFEVDKKLSTWLYSIANNMCKNEYRKQEYKQKLQAVKITEGTTSNEKSIDLRAFSEAVHSYINALNVEKQSLFRLRFKEQLSVPDISKVLDIPEGTVKSRLFHLLKELKEKLTPFQHIHIN